MIAARKVSYVLFALLAALIIFLRLGDVALAGLFSYMILDLTHRLLARRVPEFLARPASVLLFLITAGGLAWLFGLFLKLALTRMPLILASLIPRIDNLSRNYGIILPFENLQELRAVIVDTVKENARTVTKTSGLLTKGFFQILVSLFAAILFFLDDQPQTYGETLFDALRKEFRGRLQLFMQSFEKIFGAQALISFINAGITAIFILVMGVPHVHFLTLTTFIFGMLPIVGNVMSNAVVIGTALTVSPRLALASFIFLIISHKIQYFLSGHIIGSRTNIPMWQILLGLLIGEALLGVPGIILAPAVLDYLRQEAQSVPLKPS